MANTLTLNATGNVRARRSFQGFFTEMFQINGTIDDQDAVAINRTNQFDVTVTGLALGDMVICFSFGADFEDAGNDVVVPIVAVTAANVLTLILYADLSEYATDDLNAVAFKAIVGRPIF